MNELCFATNLTSSEWASWVQAIGSVLAIIAAAGIAIYQSKKQHTSAMAMFKEEQRHSHLEAARTLSVLADNCRKYIADTTAKLSDRSTIHTIAIDNEDWNLDELKLFQYAIDSIPLHSLPHALVTPTMRLRTIIRSVINKTVLAIQNHRSMDSEAFGDLFNSYEVLNKSLVEICNDISREVQQAEQRP